jgi:hypothetical protein
MKPTITVDERGIILHVTNEAGEGFAVPLSAETVAQLGLQLARAKAKLMTPEGKSQVAKALGSLFWQLVGDTKEADGTSKTDT